MVGKNDSEKRISRRKFLKGSMIAGAAAATAVATAASGIIPELASSISKVLSKQSYSKNSEQPLVAVIANGQLKVFQGLKEITIGDSTLADEISGKLTSRMS